MYTETRVLRPSFDCSKFQLNTFANTSHLRPNLLEPEGGRKTYQNKCMKTPNGNSAYITFTFNNNKVTTKIYSTLILSWHLYNSNIVTSIWYQLDNVFLFRCVVILNWYSPTWLHITNKQNFLYLIETADSYVSNSFDICATKCKCKTEWFIHRKTLSGITQKGVQKVRISFQKSGCRKWAVTLGRWGIIFVGIKVIPHTKGIPHTLHSLSITIRWRLIFIRLWPISWHLYNSNIVTSIWCQLDNVFLFCYVVILNWYYHLSPTFPDLATHHQQAKFLVFDRNGRFICI